MAYRINPNESDFVKDKRNTHCKGCMNEGICMTTEVLNCWLRETYLPKGEWTRAMKDECDWKLTCEISDEIDKKILDTLYDNNTSE